MVWPRSSTEADSGGITTRRPPLRSAPNFQCRGVKRDRSKLKENFFGPEVAEVCIANQANYGAIFNHHSFRLPGRPGCIHHVGEAGWSSCQRGVHIVVGG